MGDTTIVMIGLYITGGIILGILIDAILFKIWHNNAHSKKLKKEERKQKKEESRYWSEA